MKSSETEVAKFSRPLRNRKPQKHSLGQIETMIRIFLFRIGARMLEYRASIVSVLLIVLLLFLVNIENGELFGLYFNPEVWGTVSDYVMVVVTAITAFLLWRTLKSTNSLLVFENKRYLFGIKPNVGLTVEQTNSNNGKIRNLLIEVIFSVNDVSGATIIPATKKEGLKYRKLRMDKDFKGAGVQFYRKYSYRVALAEAMVDKKEFRFLLLYGDVEDNYYVSACNAFLKDTVLSINKTNEDYFANLDDAHTFIVEQFQDYFEEEEINKNIRKFND